MFGSMMRRIKEKRIFGVLWVLDGLGVRKKKKDFERMLADG